MLKPHEYITADDRGSKMKAIKKASVKWRKPMYRKLVEQILQDYPMMKESFEMTDLLSSCITPYEDNEKYEFLQNDPHLWEKFIWVQQIEKALLVLNEDEKSVIEKTYFEGQCTVRVCDQLGISESTYRRIKSRAIKKMAMVLNLI